MKHFAIIGSPIEHSLSPVMHKWIFDSLNMDAEYKKSKIEPEYYKYYEKRCNTIIKRLGNQDEEEDSFGSNTLKYIHMDGRIIFDVQNEVKKNSQLDSYKLDNVASHFMRGQIIKKTRIILSSGKIFTELLTNNISPPKLAFPPDSIILVTTISPCSSSISHTMTVAPSAANKSASDSPIPLLPPVTIAVLFSSLMISTPKREVN